VDPRTFDSHAKNSRSKTLLVAALGGKEAFFPFVGHVDMQNLHFLVIERACTGLVLPFMISADVAGLKLAMTHWMASSEITGRVAEGLSTGPCLLYGARYFAS
jgi:hypothetical protein